MKLPHWHEVLASAANLSQATQMGYIGVDILLDAEGGPIVLEANGRPELAVQTANGRGLKLCLNSITGKGRKRELD